jgi:hypothetical protein
MTGIMLDGVVVTERMLREFTIEKLQGNKDRRRENMKRFRRALRDEQEGIKILDKLISLRTQMACEDAAKEPWEA